MPAPTKTRAETSALVFVLAIALLAGQVAGARINGRVAPSGARLPNATSESPGALVEGEGRASVASAADVGSNWTDHGFPFKLPSLGALERGQPGQHLIPELVPPPNVVYQMKNKEKTRIVETNEYKWELDEVEFGGREFDIDAKIATLQGKWTSNTFGHKSVHVYDNSGKEIFKIRASKNVWNPFQRRWSFRILPPGSKDNEDALFTINKDQFGRGIPILWEKEEWRIYRGRERHDDMIYYCVGSWFGWDFKFYHRMEDYDNSARPVATIEQKMNAGALIEHNWLPDKFKLKVGPGEDTALLLAVSTIIDMTHDSQGASEGAINPHDGFHHFGREAGGQ